MPDQTHVGQEVAKLLGIVAALLSGEMITTTDHPEGVEVIAVMRDNWLEAPVMVRFATDNGTDTVPLERITIID